MTDSQRWQVFLIVLLCAALVYLLSPVLTPFVLAALLAYLFNPAVNRLVEWHLPRIIAVTIVFIIVILIFLGFFFLFIPVLEQQIAAFAKVLPAINHWFTTVVWPWIQNYFPIKNEFNFDHLQKVILQNLQTGSGIFKKVLTTLSHSGFALVEFITNLLLTFVVAFYLLCDWQKVTQKSAQLLPRKSENHILKMLNECGEVLSAFFRGQFLVMIVLGLIYAVGLWIIGLNIGILIGVISGLLSIVPYLGFICGILTALLAAFIQFHTWTALLWVAIVFGIGELAESFILIPWFVGDRVGLHPVAVIFALMAGGRLFGFVGVLLAVPVAAVIVVFLRHLRDYYFKSQYYSRTED